MHTTNGSQQRYRDAERMELRSYVSLAGDVIAKVWPMTSVIARNPLQGFEHLRFEDAVERGEQLFGGSGTLSQEVFREAFQRGRIHAQQLDEALKAHSSDQQIRFGDRQVAHVDILRAIMVTGACDIEQGGTAATAGPSSPADSVSVAHLTEWLRRTLRDDVQDTGRAGLSDLSEEWPYEGTMADWCDRTLGMRRYRTRPFLGRNDDAHPAADRTDCGPSAPSRSPASAASAPARLSARRLAD